MSVAPGQNMWRRSPDVAFVDDGERVVLLHLGIVKTARPQLLAGPSAAIWRATDRERSFAEICSLVSQHFGAEQGVLERDVEPFLLRLREGGILLERVRSTASSSGQESRRTGGELPPHDSATRA